MAIKDINRHWERVINTMNEALLIISEKGRILSVNRSFEEMTGYTANEVSGQPCTVLACQACEMAINSHGEGWCKLFEPDQPEMRRCRCTIKKKDGTFLPALKNASVLRDEDGTLLGAVETLTDLSEIDRLDRKVETLSRQLDDNSGFGGIIGNSEEMKAVYAIIEKAAISDAPIIIFGESGTGKELVARAIHDRGKRNGGPYVQLNCAALNESLLESELFGHVKGSFTGAFRDRDGRFETANGGDLFLDEIGDIPLSIQIKLLRVLETGQFERVGENTLRFGECKDHHGHQSESIGAYRAEAVQGRPVFSHQCDSHPPTPAAPAQRRHPFVGQYLHRPAGNTHGQTDPRTDPGSLEPVHGLPVAGKRQRDEKRT